MFLSGMQSSSSYEGNCCVCHNTWKQGLTGLFYYLHPTIFITFTRTQLHSVSLVATASFCSWDPKDVGKMCDQAVTPINLVMPKIYQHQHREPCVLQYNLYDASRRWADPIEGISLSHC